MKLNPGKCVFRVALGKFLGFMVSQRGIEANPEKVQAIIDMASPRTVKEVQNLTGRIAALNRFVSRATDKCLPFFKTLKRAFAWTDECEVAFHELKRYLSNPPLLSPSKKGEKSTIVLGCVNYCSKCNPDSGRRQEIAPSLLRQPSLPRGQVRLPKNRKNCVCLNRGLTQIKANPILVMTDQPIRKSINRPKAARRMVQWAIELSQFNIEYHPRTAIKAQALADFIAEFTFPEEDSLTNEAERWIIQTDGSSA